MPHFEKRDLAMIHGVDNVKVWRPCLIEYIIRDKKGGIKSVGVSVDNEPGNCIINIIIRNCDIG